jgi:hypothetical protein
MRRVREEIERVRPRDCVAGVDEAARIAREGGDVAGHIHDLAGLDREHAIQRLARHPGARRVNDDGVDRRAPRQLIRRARKPPSGVLDRLVRRGQSPTGRLCVSVQIFGRQTITSCSLEK